MRQAIATAVLLLLAPASAAHAASPVRLVEAVARPEWNPASVVRIAPASPQTAADSHYTALAAVLSESLTRAGMHVEPTATRVDAVVVLDDDTRRFRDTFGVNDPSYRVVMVSAVAAGADGPARLLWRTTFEQSGILTDPAVILPPMLKAAVPWYGRNLTPERQGRGRAHLGPLSSGASYSAPPSRIVSDPHR